MIPVSLQFSFMPIEDEGDLEKHAFKIEGSGTNHTILHDIIKSKLKSGLGGHRCALSHLFLFHVMLQ